MTVKIETERLTVFPVDDEEMQKLTDRETDAELKAAYGEMLDGCLREPEKRVWHAAWYIELKEKPGTVIGDLGFKGISEDGAVEIGYGLKDGFCGRGYMTEAVRAVSEWALSQKGVTKVEAETDPDNERSQRALFRAGFAPTGKVGKEGPRFLFLGRKSDVGTNGITNMKLIKLTNEYKEQLIEMIDEWREDQKKYNTDRSPGAIFKNDPRDFDYYLESLETKEETDKRVPDSVFFMLDEERNRLIGAVNIRHYLSDSLLESGGHIGDGVRPSERRRGYGTELVRLALIECRKLGIGRVLMTCDRDNVASAKTIVRNGGVLENEFINSDGVWEQRYWIDISNN